MRKQVSSETKINLVDYKTFNNKKDAIGYVKIWDKSSLYLEKPLEDINNLDENVIVFVGVIKVEGYDLITQSTIAVTSVIACSNNTILPRSKIEFS